MNRDYDGWNSYKKSLEKAGRQQTFNTGQVWWCAVGVNIGREQDGKNAQFERPILIFRKFGAETFLGLPLSTSHKEGIFYSSFTLNGRKSSVLLSQARVLSQHRLLRNMGRITATDMKCIKQDFHNLIGK
ncbi:MAG: type II toxin-antitoxin system PemK/MazF family toxin [Coriobacteriales bacterium]|jgi:mRNA interferase MazF|nr:type II toxin-antitoxin system PemK/MazF family toxin [Coriobacteriales bacterium]